MADKRITELNATTTPIGDDLLPIVTDVAGVAITKKITLGNLTKAFSVTVSTDGSGGYNCDGVSDDVQIQAALDAVYTAGGGTVLIKAGTYIVDTELEYRDNTRIIGEGRGATIIKLVDSSSIGTAAWGIIAPWGYGSGNPHAPVGDNVPLASHVTIAHLSVDGNVANNGSAFYECIVMMQVKDGTIYDCETHDAREVGINTDANNYYYAGDPEYWSVRVENCYSHDNLAEGYQVSSGSFANCVAYNNSGSGFNFVSNGRLGNYSGATCTGCIAYNNGSSGFVKEYQSGANEFPITFTGCVSINNGYGFRLGLTHGTFCGNIAAYNKGDGVILVGKFNSIIGNMIKCNGQDPTFDPTWNRNSGFTFWDDTASYNVISGNTIFDDQVSPTQEYGITYSVTFTAPEGDLIVNNVFDGNKTDPIESTVEAKVTIGTNVGYTP